MERSSREVRSDRMAVLATMVAGLLVFTSAYNIAVNKAHISHLCEQVKTLRTQVAQIDRALSGSRGTEAASWSGNEPKFRGGSLAAYHAAR